MTVRHDPQNDLLASESECIDFERLTAVRTERRAWLETRHWGKITRRIQELPELESFFPDPTQLETSCSSDVVQVGKKEDLSGELWSELESIALELKPWRKGPFQLFGLEIDSEWRSNWKWDRISAAIGDLNGKTVLDVGCGNGYYLCRAAGQGAKKAIGLDPSVPFYLQHALVQKYLRLESVQYELLGAEHVEYFDQVFDVVICMGILYHQRNPVQILKDLWRATADDGFCIIESQVIPGAESTALFPEDRYAKARNVFFVPTVECLKNWIVRAGFRSPEILSVETTTIEEQRKTRWSTFESLADFLDPTDETKTVEGYPAPMRAAIKAYR